MSVLLLLCIKQICKLLQGCCTVYHTGRIVGGIDEDCCRLLIQHFLKPVKVNLEVHSIRRHHLKRCPGHIDIRIVFREERCKGQHFIPRFRYTTDSVGNRTCCTGGRENMGCPIIHIKSAVQGFCNLFSH